MGRKAQLGKMGNFLGILYCKLKAAVKSLKFLKKDNDSFVGEDKKEALIRIQDGDEENQIKKLLPSEKKREQIKEVKFSSLSLSLSIDTQIHNNNNNSTIILFWWGLIHLQDLVKECFVPLTEEEEDLVANALSNFSR